MNKIPKKVLWPGFFLFFVNIGLFFHFNIFYLAKYLLIGLPQDTFNWHQMYQNMMGIIFFLIVVILYILGKINDSKNTTLRSSDFSDKPVLIFTLSFIIFYFFVATLNYPLSDAPFFFPGGKFSWNMMKTLNINFEGRVWGSVSGYYFSIFSLIIGTSYFYLLGLLASFKKIRSLKLFGYTLLVLSFLFLLIYYSFSVAF